MQNVGGIRHLSADFRNPGRSSPARRPESVSDTGTPGSVIVVCLRRRFEDEARKSSNWLQLNLENEIGQLGH